MPPHRFTHLPYGLIDPSKRIIRNRGIKDEAEFLRYGIETNGEYFSMRVLVKPGGGKFSPPSNAVWFLTPTGVPIHRHYGYGEKFFPVSGEIAVVGENGTKTMMLRPGGTYQVKPGEWHRFFNPSETESIVFEAEVRPAHQGFENLLPIYYGLVEDGYGTPEGAPKSMFHAYVYLRM